MWSLHGAGLGFLKEWQPQVSYMQLTAPRTGVPRESQVEAVTPFLTPSWKSCLLQSVS